MTANIDNAADALPGVIRDPITGVPLKVNADGSINITVSGSTSTDTASSIDLTQWNLPGCWRDANTGAYLRINADGSVNVVTV